MQAIPDDFCKRILEQFPEEGAAFLASLDNTPAASVRLNSAKPGVSFVGSESVPWNKEGRILRERPRYTLDPTFHAGCYYPQESSSMALQWVLEHAVPANTPVDALDLCAAPGGKSLIISDFLANRGEVDGRLISNEIIRSRAHILNEVVTKWGAPNVAVTNNKPEDFAACGMQFDLIVVDAPCSGEGMFRKDPQAREEWSTESVSMCSRRQKDVLTDILPALKQNGVLIYSTCTFAADENENQIAELLATGEFESIRWPVPSNWNVDVMEEFGVFAMRFLPHKTPGEGFFIAALRRTSSDSIRRSKPKSLFVRPTKADEAALKKCGIPADYAVVAPNGELYRSSFSEKDLNVLASSLYFLSPGTHLGKIVHAELIPAHALALAPHIESNYGTLEISREQALTYLRGETISTSASPGWQRVAFEGCVLGWIKVIGNRINNYYPKEWRVKLKE
jgi:16S rRNA C967 or C1407 C5-methylase (RsmB/RsmF family)/NOL1/NOP2/fmu family ribosome biogenesis protein